MKRDDLFDKYASQSPSSSDQEEEQQGPISSKQAPKQTYLPSEYHKAKRTINKMITQYFNQLKDQIQKGAKIYVNRARLDSVLFAINNYVNPRYGQKKQTFELSLKLGEESKKKQIRGGIFSYLSQCQKIINYTTEAKINVINLQKKQFKLPDLATPIPHQGVIYLLDPCSLDMKRKIYVPSPPALAITTDGKIKECSPPILFRSKCAIIKDKNYIYLLGGYITQDKVLTNRCEKYNPIEKSVELPPMIHRHNCPTACIVGQQIWVFSIHFLEYYDSKEWREVSLPFGGKFLPFQFVFAANETQIVIFGGINNNQKSCQVKIYNIKERYLNNYGSLLPQGICNERSWGPVAVHGCVAAISSVQASVYPQLGIKTNMSEIIYITDSSAHLSSIINC